MENSESKNIFNHMGLVYAMCFATQEDFPVLAASSMNSNPSCLHFLHLFKTQVYNFMLCNSFEIGRYVTLGVFLLDACSLLSINIWP